MSSLFSSPKMPAAPPPVPTVDNTQAIQNAQDKSIRRGRGTTVLTSDAGLPDLGKTSAPMAQAGM